ncbi:MAG: GIY-YIG nuclease family protein [Candidatus Omnitrophica bacterium]|nr:GIY-YIG nuclease family protein [Candidatus Omnitrophota bacterium]
MSVGRWFVYCLLCRDGSLYTGITINLPRRLKQHNAGTASAYTRPKRPVKLIFREKHPSRSSALRREAEIKRLPRSRKLAILRLS